MDITIQNVRSPALEYNGRYYKVFQPRTRDELLKLHHMGCVGDTVLTDIQLEQGDFPTSFVEPTVTQRTLSGLFKDMRSIELELRDPNSTLWGKIQQNNQGALTQFFDTNVKSAIAQTAKEIRQEVRDAANSARVQVTPEGVTIGSTTLTGEQLASTISTSSKGVDIIAPKVRVKSDMIVDGAVTAGKLAAGSVTAENIQAGAITGDKINVDDALIRNLTARDALIDKLTSKEIFATKIESVITSSTVLEGYKGWIGGFQLGTHDSGSGRWLTGRNHFSVGMGDGEGGSGQTALWVNWGGNWSEPGYYAWFVKNNGKMYCYNTAEFWKTPIVHGDLKVTGRIVYDGGAWIYSNGYEKIGRSSTYYFYLEKASGERDYFLVSNDTSDRRLKSNIQESSVSGIDIINRLKTYSYRKEFNNEVEDISCGIMAQDVQKYALDAFRESPDGVYTYNTFALVPYLIKAIQELNQKIEKMEKTIA